MTVSQRALETVQVGVYCIDRYWLLVTNVVSVAESCVNDEEKALPPEPDRLCSTCPLSTPRPKTLEYENQVSIFGPARRRRRRRRSRARCFR